MLLCKLYSKRTIDITCCKDSANSRRACNSHVIDGIILPEKKNVVTKQKRLCECVHAQHSVKNSSEMACLWTEYFCELISITHPLLSSNLWYIAYATVSPIYVKRDRPYFDTILYIPFFCGLFPTF